MSQKRALVYSSDAGISNQIADYLLLLDYGVATVSNESDCLAALKKAAGALELLVIDGGPDGAGSLRCLELIHSAFSIPIIALHASDAQASESLIRGADVSIAKPVQFLDLAVKCKVIQRRQHSTLEPPVVVSLNGFSLNSASRRVFVQGQEIKLTPIEFALLKELATHNTEVLSYKHLIGEVWANEYGIGWDSVHTYIKRLRRKIKAAGGNPDCIVSMPRVGYRLDANSLVPVA